MLTRILVAVFLATSVHADQQSVPKSEVEHEAFRATLAALSQNDFPDWLRRAESGDVDAQVVVGLAYRDGRGIGKNPRLAAQWLQTAAAEGGSSHGQLYLAGLYHRGYGVERDFQRAIQWALKSAEQGNVQAQYTMAHEYDSGETVKKNHNESARWYRMAAAQGHAPSQFNLAMAFYTGEGVRKDRAAAAEWLTKASEHGYAVATYYVGRMYVDGDYPGSRGGTDGEREALDKWRLAAEQGYPTAALNLGEIYADTRMLKRLGIAPDAVEACTWFEIAQALDEAGKWTHFMPHETKKLHRALQKKLPKARKQLSHDERAECERRAESFGIR